MTGPDGEAVTAKTFQSCCFFLLYFYFFLLLIDFFFSPFYSKTKQKIKKRIQEKKKNMHTAEALVANRTHASSASVSVGHTSDIQMQQVIHDVYPIAGNGLAGHDFVDHLTNKSCTGSGLLRHRNLVVETGT